MLLYIELVNGDDLTLGFIRVNDLNCLECVELNGGKEFLLCFHSKPLFHLMHTWYVNFSYSVGRVRRFEWQT